MAIVIPQIKCASVRVDGDRVVVDLGDGRAVSLPWEAARDLGRHMVRLSQVAETIATAPKIADDQALLLRTGAPVAISGDPRVLDEARKLAAHDRDLRRIPSVPSRAVVGMPSLDRVPSPSKEPS
ncbi:MAG: hypothetical protein QOI20_3268 [Acidimicrobiaceae bacterium]|jgi:hypothetical protein|nr:hypothetical protein [Acidimicrobiaceae bacterium]